MLSVEGFEGPLDWLVELARARRIDLQKISIVALIAAFEAAMLDALAPQAAAPTLARWGDWLVLAADLTLLRSRLLLPADAAETRDAEAHGEALRRLLVGRTAISVAADWLDRRTQLGRNVFARGRSDEASPAKRERAGDVTGLLRACLVALALPADAGAAYRVPATPFWTTTDAVARIRAWLPTPGEAGCALGGLLPPVPASAPDRDLRCRAALASTFVGGLELAREGAIALEQERAFGQIQPGDAITRNALVVRADCLTARGSGVRFSPASCKPLIAPWLGQSARDDPRYHDRMAHFAAGLLPCWGAMMSVLRPRYALKSLGPCRSGTAPIGP